MGASQSTPKILVFGAPQSGRKTLVAALADSKEEPPLELVLPEESLEGVDTADAMVYVLDGTAPSHWAGDASRRMLELLHGVNQKLGKLVPLLVCVNKRDVEGSAPARNVIDTMRLSGDVCAAVGGRLWRVVDASALSGDVAEVRHILVHMSEAGRRNKPMQILAPKFMRYGWSDGSSAGDARGACASLP